MTSICNEYSAESADIMQHHGGAVMCDIEASVEKAN